VYGPGKFISDDLLSVGTYTVKFAHPDLEPAELPVELILGRTIHLTPPQKPLPGELRVFSVPTGAEVSINGKRAGTTPATLPAQPSEVSLSVEVFARGYRRSTQTITLRPKEVRTVNVGTLVAESGAVDFRFSNLDFGLIKPAVKLDGKPIDAARAVEGLEIGRHTVEVVHGDYEPWRREVTVRDQETSRVDVTLAPKPGRLTLRANVKEFSLTLNGRVVRADEMREDVLLLPAGEAQTLVVGAKGYQSASRTLTMAANGLETWGISLEKLRAPEVGQEWTIPDVSLTLIPIAAGTFKMGSENGNADEKPITQVTITRPFWLGKTEVTQAQWAAVMGNNPSNFKGESRPVEQVSWDETMEFCRRLTDRERAAGRMPEGYAYTLPTEAQWEYACRAGTTGDYARSLDATAWHSGNSGNQTHEVGAKQANVWGLHDMLGNVWEWCLDWYGAYPGGSMTDPAGARSGSFRVDRGGGWVGTALFCRSDYRDWGEPGRRSDMLGFRLSLSSTGLVETTTAPITPVSRFSSLSQITADQNATSQEQPPAPARLGAGMKDLFDSAELDQKPVARVMAPPAYPFEMRRAGISGEVMVEFIVDTSGDVILAQVTRSSRREFEAAAIRTVQKWKFKPGRKDGRVVNTRAFTPVVFSLAE
ncbi:MAG TPA: TonB family protein, partial [Acidobacteriota bacterium]|nr:TonB family protein [Acidobacteriota bacterium]